MNRLELAEMDVLKDVLAENERFHKKLEEFIKECELGDNKYYSKFRGGVKRSALDLRKELAKITTATGSYGIYYYDYS